MSYTYVKPSKVGKVRRFSADVSAFSAGQPITSMTFTSLKGFVSISHQIIDSNVISALVTGLSVGVDDIRVSYSTESRSSCETVKLNVVAC